ncbi:MAG TPA: mannose-6-phosphate isomerase, class I [Candidatus Marinimicrobia bacterium]|nr:mannose-6-phosphate isomerase, class I [Candidatus Neomarinimicrobiota bacterium]HRS51331.1 mannose-6-phosphate isomerase, class I [Candidatus Neomarinimicrobiota bacterium]HRU91431.1 mannose-6-phosphate isomerase, class I [Candidatus Neomarinimicrobiota bacterium]
MENNFEIKPYILKNKIQHYEWGTRGEQAFIPKLLGIKYEGNRPYAELWIGAHPSAPSQVSISNNFIDLTELIRKHPIEILGEPVFKRFGANLPFLFKVLSAGKPLSIQAHPNKLQAVRLHTRDPINYPDSNHKLEIAIAIDCLKALVGLLNVAELSKKLELYPVIQSFTDMVLPCDTKISELDETVIVKRFYSTLIRKSTSEPQLYGNLVESLAESIRARSNQISEPEYWFLELKKYYPPSDIGLILILLMNYIHLDPGQAIKISAGIPHAYLSGNIIECMTNSDNVVRVGLTNKYKDTSALLEILDYSPRKVQIFNPDLQDGISIYQSSAEEFFIMNMKIEKNFEKKFYTNDKVQIGLILNGQIELNWNSTEKLILKKGESVLIPACIKEYVIRSRNSAEVYITSVD